jgi:uncharacterized protein DUF2203
MKWLAANRPVIPYLIKEFKIPLDAPVPPDYFSNLLTVRRVLGEVDTLGVQIKDIQMGLVDFPSKLLGKNVLLCWRLGEEAVEFYHDLESGYAGRQPIPEGRSGSGEDPGDRGPGDPQ